MFARNLLSRNLRAFEISYRNADSRYQKVKLSVGCTLTTGKEWCLPGFAIFFDDRVSNILECSSGVPKINVAEVVGGWDFTDPTVVSISGNETLQTSVQKLNGQTVRYFNFNTDVTEMSQKLLCASEKPKWWQLLAPSGYGIQTGPDRRYRDVDSELKCSSVHHEKVEDSCLKTNDVKHPVRVYDSRFVMVLLSVVHNSYKVMNSVHKSVIAENKLCSKESDVEDSKLSRKPRRKSLFKRREDTAMEVDNSRNSIENSGRKRVHGEEMEKSARNTKGKELSQNRQVWRDLNSEGDSDSEPETESESDSDEEDENNGEKSHFHNFRDRVTEHHISNPKTAKKWRDPDVEKSDFYKLQDMVQNISVSRNTADWGSDFKAVPKKRFLGRSNENVENVIEKGAERADLDKIVKYSVSDDEQQSSVVHDKRLPGRARRKDISPYVHKVFEEVAERADSVKRAYSEERAKYSVSDDELGDYESDVKSQGEKPERKSTSLKKSAIKETRDSYEEVERNVRRIERLDSNVRDTATRESDSKIEPIKKPRRSLFPKRRGAGDV